MKARFSLFLLILLIACDKDKDASPEDNLWVYANRFYDEASARNITLDRSLVTLKFVAASEIAPYAGYGTVDPPLVRIVKTYWDNYTDVQKEILMFHELGHAVLRRPHTNELLPSCDYKSMMMDGNQFVVYNEVSIKRDYYIDELFDPNTPYPGWGGAIGSNKTVIVDNFSTATFHLINQQSYSGEREEDGSLHIRGGGTDGLAFWQLEIPSENIPSTSTVVAKFQIKTTDVTGGGVWAILEGNDNRYFKTATNLYQPSITGTNDYSEFTLILNCYPSETVMVLTLFLGGQSTGDAWFKDVEVSYHN